MCTVILYHECAQCHIVHKYMDGYYEYTVLATYLMLADVVLSSRFCVIHVSHLKFGPK